jgi:hypothetical protein
MAENDTRQRLIAALTGPSAAPYTAPVSEFTTPADMQRQRISAALGWDVGRPWAEFARRVGTDVLAAFPGRAPAGMLRTRPQPQAPVSPVPSSEPGYVPSSPYYASIPPLPRPDRVITRGGVIDNPAATPVPRQPTQGQRDLHSLSPHFRQDMEASASGIPGRAWDNRNQAERFWLALKEFETMRPPPRNRMHSFAPLAAAASGISGGVGVDAGLM